jgi:hypothetical protein
MPFNLIFLLYCLLISFSYTPIYISIYLSLYIILLYICLSIRGAMLGFAPLREPDAVSGVSQVLYMYMYRYYMYMYRYYMYMYMYHACLRYIHINVLLSFNLILLLYVF